MGKQFVSNPSHRKGYFVKSPGNARPPTLGHNIDWCIIAQAEQSLQLQHTQNTIFLKFYVSVVTI